MTQTTNVTKVAITILIILARPHWKGVDTPE
jgi:hypothetical protein